MKKIIIFVVAIAVLAGAGWYGYTKFIKTSDSSDGSNVVALVNGQELTGEQLDALKTQIATAQGVTDLTTLTTDEVDKLHTAALDSLIGQVLLEQAVTASGNAPTSEEVDTEIAAMHKRFKTQEDFDAALAQENLTLEGLRTRISKDMATQRYLATAIGTAEKFAVSEAEVTAAYKKAVVGADSAPSLKDAHDQIKLALTQQKQQKALSDLVAKLRAAASIEIK